MRPRVARHPRDTARRPYRRTPLRT
jgi:hypothetical protein